MNRTAPSVLVAALLAGVATPSAASFTPSLEWARQLGTSTFDAGYGVAVDNLGNAYISGPTGGNLAGWTGASDPFLAKYDAAGNNIWTRQIGTAVIDNSLALAFDGLGNLYITGITNGALGGPNAGESDAFVSKFDTAGNLIWTRQFGTVESENGSSIAADSSGNVFITGQTYGALDGPNAGSRDAFVTKYDAAGNLAWTRQLGTATADYGNGVATDGSGNAYITGTTSEALGGAHAGARDAFVAKYDSAGNVVWTRQLGTPGDDISSSIAVDAAGNAYIGGFTDGALEGTNAGSDDLFLAKYDTAGNLDWTRQIGTAGNDQGLGVGLDSSGHVYLTGLTDGTLDGTNAGSYDVFLVSFDVLGNLAWTEQVGSTGFDRANAVALEGSSSAYITGYTQGSLGGPIAGSSDAFLVKINVPEPSSIALLGIGGTLMARRRRR